MKKITCILTGIIIILPILSGCYDRKEIDDLTYAIAVGFDKGKVNDLRLTLQYAQPASLSGGGGGSSSGGEGGSESASKISNQVTIDTPALFAGLNLLNNSVGKEISLSHAVVVVFSEELAKSGKIYDYLHAMLRSREFRPGLYVAVARGTAEDYISSIKPKQELDLAKYYELKFSSYNYTGFTADTRLSRFYYDIESPTADAIATLVGVSSYQNENDFDPNKSTNKRKERIKTLEGDYLAGDIPKVGAIKGETMGLAVFSGGKMTGELDGTESTYYLMASGEFNHSYITFVDPKMINKYVILDIKQRRNPVLKVQFINGKPIINETIKLEGDILSIQSGINYEDQYSDVLEKSVEDFLQKEISEFLTRTSAELNSDICGFGNEIRGNFLTWRELENFNWKSKYKDALFNIKVQFKLRRPGLIIRSIPAYSSEGKEE